MNTRLILIGFLLLALKVQGQFKDPTPQSPEASELSKSINYPVGHYTGIADISVPLFGVSAGSINLPFMLKYHSGGFKVNEREGCFGLGWSLSPTLQISRSIRGKDDLINLDNSHNDGYATNAFCKGSNGASIMYEGSEVNNYLRRYYAYKRDEDHEPDQFNYSLLGKSGSFYFQKESNGTVNIVPSPYNGVKIEQWGNGFRITDTDGTIYNFDAEVEKTAPQSTYPEIWDTPQVPITTWKCRSVLAANKSDYINFNYLDKAPIYTYSFSKNAVVTESECDLSTFFTNLNQLLAANIDPSYTTHQQVMNLIGSNALLVREPSPKIKLNGYGASGSGILYPYLNSLGQVQNRSLSLSASGYNRSVTEIRGKKLNYITFNGGRIDFEYTSGSDQISAIILKSTVTGEVKRVVFNQSYEGTLPPYSSYSPSIEIYKEHYTWYLDGLTVNDANYSFDYYGSRPTFNNYSYGSDIWGYPNGKTHNGFNSISYSQFMPVVKHNAKVYGASCHVNATKDVPFGTGGVFANYSDLQKGVLKRITYPTKGYTEFIYENNLANPNCSSFYGPVTVGGLRIKAIKNYNYNNQLESQRHYVYGEDGNGTGVSRGVSGDCLYGYDPITVGSPNYDERLKLPDLYKTVSTIKHFKHTPGFTELPKHPHETGGTYDYSTLYNETQTTWLTQPRYNINYADGSPIYYKEVVEYSEEDILLALQKGKTVYKFNDTYPWGQDIPSSTGSTGLTGLSAIFNAWQMGKPKSVTEMKYKSWINNNAVFDTIRHKEYDYEEFLRGEKVYYGQMHANVVPVGLPQGLEPRGYQINYYYKSLDIGNKLLHNEKEYLYIDGVRKQERSIDYVYDAYGQLKSTASTNSHGQPIVSSIKRPKDFTSHPSSSNLINNNMLAYPLEETSMVNGAVAKGGRYVYSTDNRGNITEVYNKTPIGDERTATYSYNTPDSKPDMMIPENGAPISFIWGYNTQYPIAKIENATTSQVTSAIATLPSSYNTLGELQGMSDADNDRTIGSSGAEGALRTALNALRNALPTAQVTTYTYDPLIGVTSMTDPRGYTIYYEYDGFNRLEAVRDADGNLVTDYEYHYRNQ